MPISTETLLQIVAFVAGAIISAVITKLVTRYTERARPNVRISNVTISPAQGSEDIEIPIDYALQNRAATNAILDNLKPTMKIQEVREYLEKSQLSLSANSIVSQFLQIIINRGNILPPAVTKDEQRKQFLLEWLSFGQPLEGLAHTAISLHYNELPAILIQPHPAEWKNPSARIMLPNGVGFSVAEVDVDIQLQNMRNTSRSVTADEIYRAVENTNVSRRIWIYLEPDHIRWLILRMLDLCRSIEASTKDILDILNDVVKVNTPEYLRVQVLISNDGNRAVAVRPFTTVWIPVIEAGEKEEILIPLVTENSSNRQSTAEIVKANDASQISFRSEVPLNSLSLVAKFGNETIDGLRLRALFESRVLQCYVAVSLTGFSVKQSHIVVSEPYDFGLPAVNRIRKEMNQSLNERANRRK